MSHHFIVKPEQISAEKITIEGRDLDHLTRVLRLRTGDKITAADGNGKKYVCVIRNINKQLAQAEIIDALPDVSEPPLEVVLLQGLPKGDKLELVIQKATELGVFRIIPIPMARSVVKLSKSKAWERNKRWQRVALEAAKQCRRSRVPVVEYYPSFSQALGEIHQDALILLPWENEKSIGIKEVLTKEENLKKRQIALIIGPEGGFDEKEVEEAKKLGALSLSLGPRILRTETAALAALAMIMYQIGDLGGV